MNRIAIIDYGMGNLHSVASAVQLVAPEAQVFISQNHQDIRAADRVIFRGWAPFVTAWAKFAALGFIHY